MKLLGLLGNDPGKSNHDIVRDYWASQRPEKDKAFEDFWERSLHDGSDGRHGAAGNQCFSANRLCRASR